MTQHFITFQFLLLIILICTTITTTLAQSTIAPAPLGPTNITKILEKAGQFTTLIHLLDITEAGDQINKQLKNYKQGMTVFAPTDNAFSTLATGTLNSLSDEQKVALVQFHIIPNYIATTQFQTLSNPVRTQAGDSDYYSFPLNVTISGNSVNISTGVVNATVDNTIYTDGALVVYQVDKVLLPMSLFGPQPPAAAPAPEPVKEKKKKAADDDIPATDEDSGNAKSSGFHLRCDLHGLMAGVIAFIGMFYM